MINKQSERDKETKRERERERDSKVGQKVRHIKFNLNEQSKAGEAQAQPRMSK